MDQQTAFITGPALGLSTLTSTSRKTTSVSGDRAIRAHARVQRRLWNVQKRELPLCMNGQQTSTHWDLDLSSPSKINLFLRIIRKREDGYHDLASLFQSISLSDRLLFRIKSADDDKPNEDTMEADSNKIPLDSSNLILKAIKVYRKRTNCTKHFHVRLEKKVPVEAGLGGGSGNAATALWAANELCGKLLNDTQLADLGAEFGSDISFFFSSGTAYCTGRGEIFRSLNKLPPTTLYIVKPNVGLSTGSVFKALQYDKLSKEDPELLLQQAIETDVLLPNYVNDLEGPSFNLMPSLAVFKQRLQSFGFPKVLMSGSGTSFYCLGNPKPEYRNSWQADMSKEYPGLFIQPCHFVNRQAGAWYH